LNNTLINLFKETQWSGIFNEDDIEVFEDSNIRMELDSNGF
jgi:hypothetical protein